MVTKTGFTVYCSGGGGGGTEAKGQHGVGIAIEESILQDIEQGGLAVEFFLYIIQCSTHEGATKLEGEIEWDFLCGCVRSD